MQFATVYREIETWKKPLHISKTLLAKSYLKLLPNLEIIGISGSVGKTLTQNAIYAVCAQKFKTVAGDENLDPTFRIPKTILSAKPWDQKMILEYGVEHPGDMDYYLSIVKPKVAVVTVIAPTHIKYFGDVAGVFAEKSKLVRALSKDGQAILNADDPYSLRLANLTKARVWFYGQNAYKGVKISHFSQSLDGSKFRLHFAGQKATVSWKVVGRHQLLSAYAAATVGLVFGLTIKQIAKGLSRTLAPAHRLNVIVRKDINIIDDTYNASPMAVFESLATLIDLGRGRQKIAVLGEMKDLGKLSEESHQIVGQKIAKSKINYLITVGRVASVIGETAKSLGFGGKILNVASAREAIVEVKKIMQKRGLILVKGSRHAHLERIVLGLLGKPTRINCYHCGELK